MAHGTALEIVALDAAGKTFAFGGAGNVDELAFSEHVHADRLADLVLGRCRETELANKLDRFGAGLGEMTFQRFGYMLILGGAETQLHRIVAVAFDRLILKYDAGAGLDDRYRDYFALLGEDLRHTKFLAQNSFSHLCHPLTA